MKEVYLHHLWKYKRLPFHQMQLQDGCFINIIDTGKYNQNESGPDFFLSKIRYENLILVGSVEMHVSSSDWYRHKHHLDPAYDNVILHVVFNHDREVFVQGKALPVLELKRFIDYNHFEKFLQIKRYCNSNKFPCKSYADAMRKMNLQEMIVKAIDNRFQRKCLELENHSRKTEEELLYLLIARSFGTKINQQPFEQLANIYSLDYLKQVKKLNNLNAFMNELFSNPIFQWKKKGLRNASAPERRFPVFIDFITQIDLNFPFWELPPSMIYEYFKVQFKQLNISGKVLSSCILINAIVFFLMIKGRLEQNKFLIKKAFRLLELLPPEDNQIIREWRELDITPQNAYESQALLEIYQQFCERKKCLDCNIGINFLNS